MLRDNFCIGVRGNSLGERLLSEDSSILTFDLTLKKAEAFERAMTERRTFAARSDDEFPNKAPTFRVNLHIAFAIRQHAITAENADTQKCCRVKKMKADAHNVTSTEIDKETDVYALHSCTLTNDLKKRKPLLVEAHINGIPVTLELDTGCEVGILTMETWQKCGAFPFEKENAKLITYGGGEINVAGVGKATVSINGHEHMSSFFVIDKPGAQIR